MGFSVMGGTARGCNHVLMKVIKQYLLLENEKLYPAYSVMQETAHGEHNE